MYGKEKRVSEEKASKSLNNNNEMKIKLESKRSRNGRRRRVGKREEM